METQPNITIRSNPRRHRYDLLDGETVIGRAHWVPYDSPGGEQRIFFHTVVDDDYSGQGLASRLARFALDDTIEAGVPIVPVCPYIASWLQKHPDYQAHAVPVLPEHLAAVPGTR